MSAKGYLPHQTIKAFVFWLLCFCLAVATVSGILCQWGVIDEISANRCLWTVLILALGSIAFLCLNLVFGDLGQSIFNQKNEPSNLDPAFSDRLRKAKAGNQSGNPPPNVGE